jgi:hypothetical protein
MKGDRLMFTRTLRNLLYVFLALLAPVAWLATRFDPYQIDGDAVAYMDIADMLRAHNWHGIVNGYWHPLYPACLALGQMLFHTTRFKELRAYYFINFVIFLGEVAAMWAFTGAVVKLRARMASPTITLLAGDPLLSLHAMRLLSLGLLVVATQRELSLGKVRPDALLQALMLAGFAAMMQVLIAEALPASMGWATLMGMVFGLAYLAKSFAFAVSMLTLIVLLGFGLWAQRRRPAWAAGVAVAMLVPFFAVAGPYIAALSHKYGHLDFGDSGALNYAWYSGDTEKMHLEPSMTDQFGTATVNLSHPEKRLLASPGIYSYKAVPEGTYPDWFDTSYFNEGVKPHVKLGPLVRRDVRNVVLVVRYLFNHPEAWVLLILLLVTGARLTGRGFPRTAFWLPMMLLGMAMWIVYGLVNIEERYVTLAYFAVVLPVFAMLHEPTLQGERDDAWPRRTAAAMVAVFAFLALGESLRIAFEERRMQPAGVPAWQDPKIFGAGAALADLGVKPGDEIACLGVTACLHDHYWARLAGVRITTEIFGPGASHLLEAWEDLPNHQQAIDVVRAQGGKVLVAYFDPSDAARISATTLGWRPLGETGYYALPLNITLPPATPVPPQPWVTHAQGNQ